MKKSLFIILFLSSVNLQAQLYPAKHKSDKYGYKNNDSAWAIQPTFSNVHPFSEGMAAASDEKYWGFINETGKWLIKPKYQEARSFHFGLAAVKDKKGRFWRYIDASGKTIISKINSSISYKMRMAFDFFYNVAICKAEAGVGYFLIDRNGNELLRFKSAGYWDKKYNRLRVKTYEGYFYINEKGDTITPISKKYFALSDNPVVIKNRKYKMVVLDSLGQPQTDSYDTLRLGQRNQAIVGSYNYEKGKGFYYSFYVFNYKTKKAVIPEEDYPSIVRFNNSYYMATTRDSNYFVFDKEGREKLHSDTPVEYRNGFFIFTNNEMKQGIANDNFDVIVEPGYNSFAFDNYSEGVIMAQKPDSTFYLFDKNFQSIEAANKYEITSVFETKKKIYYIIKKGKYFGVLNSEYKEILPPNKYTKLKMGCLKDEFCIAVYQNKWGVLDYNLKKIVPNVYSDINLHHSKNQLFIVEKERWKWGVIDSNKKTILPPTFSQIVAVGDFWLASDDKKRTIIGSKYGQKITTVNEFYYNEIDDPFISYQNLGVYETNQGDFYFLDALDGTYLAKKFNIDYSDRISFSFAPPKYIRFISQKDFRDDVPPKYCYINIEKKMVSSFYTATGTIDCKTVTKRRKKYKKERIRKPDVIFIVPAIIKQAKNTKKWLKAPTKKYTYKDCDYSWEFFGGDFKEGLALVSKNDRYGYVDPAFQTVIEIKYKDATQFKNGYASVLDSTMRRWGLIDREENFKIEPKYQDPLIFNDGFCPIKTRKGRYFIDINNKAQFNEKFSDIQAFSEGMGAVKKGKFWGFINTKGKLVIDYRFDSVKPFKNGIAKVWQDKLGYYIYINKKGEEVFL